MPRTTVTQLLRLHALLLPGQELSDESMPALARRLRDLADDLAVSAPDTAYLRQRRQQLERSRRWQAGPGAGAGSDEEGGPGPTAGASAAAGGGAGPGAPGKASGGPAAGPLPAAKRPAADAEAAAAPEQPVGAGGQGPAGNVAAAGPGSATEPSEPSFRNVAPMAKFKAKFHKPKKVKKPYDPAAYRTRLIALEVMYIGWEYSGFASQENTPNTVEAALFAALRRCRLVGEDAGWEEMEYSRCGRTDKGVSATSQVVALRVRSLGRVGAPEVAPEAEQDYAASLNQALPEGVYVLGWAPVGEDFSARFSAVAREYKYFFSSRGQLDLGAMRAAAGHLVGVHDFRHFCKVDAMHVKCFVRELLHFSIEEVAGLPSVGPERLYAMHTKGSAFLWHQVRCMAAVLFMVGRGLEPPEVILGMLDTAKRPQKPQYALAPEDPLLFSACHFPDLPLRHSAQALAITLLGLRARRDRQLRGLGLLDEMCRHLEGLQATAFGPVKLGSGPAHQPLLSRATEPAIEQRLAKYGTKLVQLDGQPVRPRKPYGREQIAELHRQGRVQEQEQEQQQAAMDEG